MLPSNILYKPFSAFFPSNFFSPNIDSARQSMSPASSTMVFFGEDEDEDVSLSSDNVPGVRGASLPLSMLAVSSSEEFWVVIGELQIILLSIYGDSDRCTTQPPTKALSRHILSCVWQLASWLLCVSLSTSTSSCACGLRVVESSREKASVS